MWGLVVRRFHDFNLVIPALSIAVVNFILFIWGFYKAIFHHYYDFIEVIYIPGVTVIFLLLFFFWLLYLLKALLVSTALVHPLLTAGI